MEHIKATIRGDIWQFLFSLCVLAGVVLCFSFVPDILLLIAIILLLFGVMSALSAALCILEIIRAKDALTRMEMSLQGPKREITTQIKKVILLSRPAPKFDEYLICAILYTHDGESYIYPFSKPIDASADAGCGISFFYGIPVGKKVFFPFLEIVRNLRLDRAIAQLEA